MYMVVDGVIPGSRDISRFIQLNNLNWFTAAQEAR